MPIAAKDLRPNIAELRDPVGETYSVLATVKGVVLLVSADGLTHVAVHEDNIQDWTVVDTRQDVTQQCELVWNEITQAYELFHGVEKISAQRLNYEVVGMKIYLLPVRA